jgi:hypothetical protein
MESFMNTSRNLFFLLALPVFLSAQTPAAPYRIGTYDSRAVAVAWAGSELGRKSLAELTQEHQKAEAAGDEKRTKQLEALGATQQARMHQQAFGTGSVAELMDLVKGGLPAVAKARGVQVLVASGELSYRDESVQVVDVTDSVVNLFHPTEQSLKWIEQLKQTTPQKAAELDLNEMESPKK